MEKLTRTHATTNRMKNTPSETQRPALADSTGSLRGSAEDTQSAELNQTMRCTEETPATAHHATARPLASTASAEGKTEVPAPTSGWTLVHEETMYPASASTGVEPADEAISARVFRIIQQRDGAPEDPVSDWIQAERELRNC